LPVPPPPVPPPVAKPSPNTQPNPVKSPAPESRELLNTLQKLRALEQREAPHARANPTRGGAPNGGGTPDGDVTNALSVAQRGALGDHVHACWTYDAGAPGVDQLQVLLSVTTDAGGVVRQVQVAPADQGRMNDPVFRAFAERARRALLDPQCANLPLPPSMLGQVQTFMFRFRP
jgi:hypothetical protein